VDQGVAPVLISLDFEEAWPESGVCANSESAILSKPPSLEELRRLFASLGLSGQDAL
jgi:hypothetical protein